MNFILAKCDYLEVDRFAAASCSRTRAAWTTRPVAEAARGCSAAAATSTNVAVIIAPSNFLEAFLVAVAESCLGVKVLCHLGVREMQFLHNSNSSLHSNNSPLP